MTGIERQVVEARTHGRFLLRPPAPGACRGILVGCHGYMENAERHLAELVRVPGAERWVLVAIDALHAFYERRTEEVVRGWMTRDLRLEAIEDNLLYVRSILDRVRPRFGWKLPLVFFGFSQGVAMAWRAAVRGGHGGALVALAGDVPPELLALPPEVPFPRPLLLATGSGDDWYPPARLDADVAALAARGVAAERLVFDGGHVWSDAFRAAAGAFLAAL